MSELIAPHVSRVVAVDGSTDMVQAARKRLKGLHQVEVRRGDMEALPIDDGSSTSPSSRWCCTTCRSRRARWRKCSRVLKCGGRVMIVDMLPHDRVEYQQQMGHVWLGFSEKTMKKYLDGAGFEKASVAPLPADEAAKGPSLFVATARKVDSGR